MQCLLLTSFNTNGPSFLVPKNRDSDTAFIFWIGLQVQLLQIGNTIKRIFVLAFELPTAFVQEPMCGIQGDHVFESLQCSDEKGSVSLV